MANEKSPPFGESLPWFFPSGREFLARRRPSTLLGVDFGELSRAVSLSNHLPTGKKPKALRVLVVNKVALSFGFPETALAE